MYFLYFSFLFFHFISSIFILYFPIKFDLCFFFFPFLKFLYLPVQFFSYFLIPIRFDFRYLSICDLGFDFHFLLILGIFLFTSSRSIFFLLPHSRSISGRCNR
ncbi:hypothetical protein ES319_A07G124400v1 [Gossypium barbadense]|uniref:Uncharacterized protein n=1 Tax=Gossypium barbadense TaxID=3634 RepID=A0A5J5V2D2_GOSBA|nr:hypothetical protein ES319_A07G124400v1 [Gossypium barbadense]